MHLADFLQITLQLLGQLHQGWEPSWTNTHIFQNLPKALEISEVLTFHFRPRALSARPTSSVSVQPRWSCRGLNTVRLEARGGLSLPTGLSYSGGKSLCARVVYILKFSCQTVNLCFHFYNIKIFIFIMFNYMCVWGGSGMSRGQRNPEAGTISNCTMPDVSTLFSFSLLCVETTPLHWFPVTTPALIVVCVDTKRVCLSSGQKCQARQCPWTLYSWHTCQHLFTLFLPLSWTTFQNS